MLFVTKSVLPATAVLTCLLALSACSSGMSGSWVPSQGSVDWLGGDGYDLGQVASRPGGLVIAKEGGGYKVTLVSSDGSRYPTSTKMEGARLGIYLGGEGAPLFFLTQTASDTLSMQTNGNNPPNLEHVMDFKQGAPSP